MTTCIHDYSKFLTSIVFIAYVSYVLSLHVSAYVFVVCSVWPPPRGHDLDALGGEALLRLRLCLLLVLLLILILVVLVSVSVSVTVLSVCSLLLLL